MISIVFSGQGSQISDAGESIVLQNEAAGQLHAQACRELGYDPLSLSSEHMKQTQFAQPAILTLSLALWEALLNISHGKGLIERVDQASFAGFSLGEYTALGAVGILEYAELFRLVQKRAEWMQAAALKQPGGMAAVIGLPMDRLASVLREPDYLHRVFIANNNAPDQIVISGSSSVLPDCMERCLAAGARRVMRLPVNGAFHTPLMAAAAESLFKYAAKCSFRPVRSTLFRNTDGQRVLPDIDWPGYLAEHMCSPVCWVDEIQSIKANGVSQFYELGPDKTLSRLITRIVPDAQVQGVNTLATVREAAENLAH